MSLLPLAGCDLYLVGGDEDESRSVELSTLVHSLGGTVVHDVSAAQVVLWCGSTTHDFAQPAQLMAETMQRTGNATHAFAKRVLQLCWQRQIPVVEPSWLEQVSGVVPEQGEHWSMVNTQLHAPAVMAFMSKSTTTVVTQVANTARRDSSAQLGKSISETFSQLTQSDPDGMELSAIQRAVELSMLDHALVYHKKVKFKKRSSRDHGPDPHTVLHLPEQASAAEIKLAFRSLARKHHPDKGGDAEQFQLIARAYRTLLSGGHDVAELEQEPTQPRQVKGTAHWDSQLQDHKRLVQDMFTAASANLTDSIASQAKAIKQLGLLAQDAGTRTLDERNQVLQNSCFYLSLAASYLHGIGALQEKTEIQPTDDNPSEQEQEHEQWDQALIGDTALQLKRIIEAAVVKAHPEWAAQGMVGDHIQAFSDFLTYVLEEQDSLVAGWAVVVFDSCSGFCDVYKGAKYADNKRKFLLSGAHTTNTITIKYIPGHYQPLVPRRPAERPSLQQVLQQLDANGVFYVVTDGA